MEDGRWGAPVLGCLKEALRLSTVDAIEHGQVPVAYTAAQAGLGAVAYCQHARGVFIAHFRATKAETLQRYVPVVESNLALTYHAVDRPDDAESAYLLALDECRKLSNDPEVKWPIPMIYHNLIDLFQELGRQEEAKSLMDLAYDQLPDDVFGALIRDRKATYAMHKGDLLAVLLWDESGLAHAYAMETKRLAAIARSSRLTHHIGRFLNRQAADNLESHQVPGGSWGEGVCSRRASAAHSHA